MNQYLNKTGSISLIIEWRLGTELELSSDLGGVGAML